MVTMSLHLTQQGLLLEMKTNKENGFIVGSLLVLIVFISVMLITITSTAIANFQSSVKENTRVNAQFAADSGLDRGIHEINQDSLWTGTAGLGPGGTDEIELLNDATNNIRSTYEVTISPGATDDNKIVRSIGRTYKPASDTTPTSTRIFEVEIINLVASNTSIVTGVGGLVMNNSAKIIDGSVYANGEIYMDNTSQIGTSTNPLSVFVANKVCPKPPDATYPQFCGPGVNNNPIHILSPNSYLYGLVHANHQFDDTNMINVDNPGDSSIQTSSGVAEQALPIHDRVAMIASLPYANPEDSSVGTPGSSASCTTNGGTKIWGGATGLGEKIKGNVVVSNKCNVEIRGPVWITGSLEMRNQGKVIVADSLGSTRPEIMIDDMNGLKMNQSSEFVRNSSGTNVEIITYWSSAACSPSCANVSGVDLANSQDIPTIDIVNSGGAYEAIFYSKWSKVIIRNSVNVGALVGQIVELEQSATIAFSSDLPGFTPRSTWIKKGYLRVYQ